MCLNCVHLFWSGWESCLISLQESIFCCHHSTSHYFSKSRWLIFFFGFLACRSVVWDPSGVLLPGEGYREQQRSYHPSTSSPTISANAFLKRRVRNGCVQIALLFPPSSKYSCFPALPLTLSPVHLAVWPSSLPTGECAVAVDSNIWHIPERAPPGQEDTSPNPWKPGDQLMMPFQHTPAVLPS